VLDAKIRQRVVDECLVPYLNDTRDAWFMLPDGTYKQVVGAGALSAQAELAKRHTPLIPSKRDGSMAAGT
jgi:polyphosphate kinase